MRALAALPFVLVGAVVVGGVGLGVYEWMTAERRAREACVGGESRRCVELMRSWATAPDKRGEAWELGTERCLAGMLSACEELSALERLGPPDQGPDLNATLERGCELGQTALCTRRALQSMGHDDGEGRVWLTRACRADEDFACATLGEWLLEGRGGPKDRAEGLRYLEIACLLQPLELDDRKRGSRACQRLAKERQVEAGPR